MIVLPLLCVTWWRSIPASAAQCVRPLLGGEGAGEGEPTSVYRSPAREVEEAVGEEKIGGREEET